MPVLVNVTGTEALAPTITAPKLMLAGFAERPACVPVPLSGTVNVPFVAFDVIVTVPEAAPAVVGANFAVNVAVAPAAICCPLVRPVLLNPVPVVVAWLIVIAALPEFVRVMVCWLELPTTTLLKLKLPGFALSVLPLATALPVSESVCGEFGALSVKTMLPVAPAVEVGVNCTLKERFAPGESVFGRARPVIPKPVPESVARLIVRLAFPLLLSVTFCVLVCPTVTLLKFKDAGDIVSAGSMPVPLNEMAVGEFEASLVTVNAPLAAPMAVGANCICTVTLCPTGTEDDGLPPTTVKPAPVILAAEMLTGAVPVFVTVTLWVALLPTDTFPNDTVVELGESTPAPPVEPPPVPPPPPAAVV